MSNTIFDKIINREIAADIVHEDEHCLAFRDVNPQAPVHILLIPKEPIAKLADADASQQELLGYLLMTLKQIAADQQLQDYRIVINNGAGAGQSVFHLHLHLLAGRSFSWPPG